MKYNKILTITALSALIGLGACKRSLKDEDIYAWDPDSTEIIAAPDNFSVTGESFTMSVPFSSVNIPANEGNMYFQADFSDKVSWRITITNPYNNAEKIISGVSNQINQSNSSWDGSSDNAEFFSNSDSAICTLSITGFDKTYVEAKKVGTMKAYHQRTYNGVYHILVDDFDLNRNYQLSGASDGKDDVTFETSAATRGQGNAFLMSGTDQVPTNGWLGDLSTELTDMVGAVTTEEADSLYFNVMIYGAGLSNSKVQLFTWEIDNADDFAAAQGGTYTYSTSLNDKYVYNVDVNWEGWQMISVPYTSFQKANDPATGGNGNKVKEPHRISAIGVSMLSDPEQGQTVEAQVDFFLLSQNGPIQK